MCHEHFPDFVFLLEPKNSSDHVLSVWRSLGYNHYFLVNPVGLSGGLALFWKNTHTVEVLYSDNILIDTMITVGLMVFYMSFVYGDPVRHRRRFVWDRIKTIGFRRDEAWFLVGDFNEIMNNSEKLGGPQRIESSF